MKSSLLKAFALSCMVSCGIAHGMQAVDAVKEHVNRNMDGSPAGTAILAGEALALGAICYLAWDHIKAGFSWFDNFVRSNSKFVPSATLKQQMQTARSQAQRGHATRVEGAPEEFNQAIKVFAQAYASGKTNGAAFNNASKALSGFINGTAV